MEWADMKTSPWEWDNLVLFYGNNCKIKEEHAAVNHHEASGPRNGKSSCDDLRGTRTSARSDDNHGLEQHQKPTENDGDVVTVAVAAGSADSVIGLKLGKRTYFEDTGGVKPISSTPVPISSTPVPAKKQRSLMQPNQIPRCQVEGCRADLTLAKDYHRRHKPDDSFLQRNIFCIYEFGGCPGTRHYVEVNLGRFLLDDCSVKASVDRSYLSILRARVGSFSFKVDVMTSSNIDNGSGRYDK